MTESIQHPALGKVTGKSEGGVVQYLGIKYATLKNRLADPELVVGSKYDHVDSTKTGPQALSLPMACDMDLHVFQKTLPHEEFEISDLDGLHLNVTVPKQSSRPQSGLPVLVFIHGGGFILGSNAWPQYDMARLVKSSANLGMPIIGVSINYRLGAPGFLASEELSAAGYKLNRGILDQRTALQWISRNIAGFGGEPEKVTLMGQSAGSAATTFHLLGSQEVLFQQVVLMSGSPMLLRPLPTSVAEFAYLSALKALAAEQLSPSDRVKTLIETSGPDLIAKIPMSVPFMPVIDGDIITEPPSFKDLGDPSKPPSSYTVPKWCRRVMIGDCQYDGSIFEMALQQRKNGLYQAFHESINRTLGAVPGGVGALEAAYDIHAASSDDDVLRNILKFVTDIGYYATTRALVSVLPLDTFVYHFNEPNPWDGKWKGEASHMIDSAFLFLNFHEYLPSEQHASEAQLTKDVIAFVCGRDPYPPSREGAMIYGPPLSQPSFVKDASHVERGRRDTIFKLAERMSLDDMMNALQIFISGQ